MTTFHLPDLGEGLAEAEIVAWHVKEGDEVLTDQPMASVETAKAVVEVPSPFTGKILKLHAKAGDVVATGGALVEFQLAAGANEPAHQGAITTTQPADTRGDAATVVGFMPVSDRDWVERSNTDRRQPTSGGRQRVRAAPSARILAKKLGIELARIQPTGRNGLTTIDDILNSTEFKSAGRSAFQMPKLGDDLTGEFEPLRGPRRTMAHAMAVSRDEIAMCTIFDDADLHAWPSGTDITARTIRAICAGVKAAPTLNAVFDPAGNNGGPARRLIEAVHLGIAVDDGDRLLVPVIRNADGKNLSELRADVKRLKEATRNRTLAPEELRDYTITLSNFGTLAGRYATPIVVPPTVAILGSGKIRRDVVATAQGIEAHPRMPLSLTFDHRCITGGESCRFLAAMIEDLEKAQ